MFIFHDAKDLRGGEVFFLKQRECPGNCFVQFSLVPQCGCCTCLHG
jgi:hypothetical protein